MSQKNYVDFKGVYKELAKLDNNLNKAVSEAISEATVVAAKQLQKNAPNPSQRKGEHIKNKVVYTKPKNNETQVGFHKDVAWRVHFLEFGTIKMRPKPFVNRTMKEVENEVAKIIQNAILRRLQ